MSAKRFSKVSNSRSPYPFQHKVAASPKSTLGNNSYMLNSGLQQQPSQALKLARDTDEEEETNNLDSIEKAKRDQVAKNVRLEKFRIKKKSIKGFARNLKYDHEAYMAELSHNNKKLKEEDSEQKRITEK